MPGNRNDCKAWGLSGAKAAVGNTMVIADGGAHTPQNTPEGAYAPGQEVSL